MADEVSITVEIVVRPENWDGSDRRAVRRSVTMKRPQSVNAEVERLTREALAEIKALAPDA